MKSEWKKVLEWLNNHKLVYVLIGILVVLALYCTIFSPLIDHALGLDEETIDSGITVGERVTGSVHVSPEEAQSMECYLEYYRPDSIISGEYATGEWQSRVVYRDNGTTFYEEDNDWCESQEETIWEETLEGILDSQVPSSENKKETLSERTTTEQVVEVTTTVASLTTASPMVAGTEMPTFATTPVPTTSPTTISPSTVSPSTQPSSEKQTEPSIDIDPFERDGWTKTKEDAFFKYYQNGEWNISWCFRDYGGGDFDEIMIYEYLGKETQVTVPSKIAGKSVTAMCNTFLDSKIHFANITIPASVRELYGTFGRAYYVSRITFETGSKLSFIDDRAFGGTHKGGDDWEQLTTIVCEKRVESIIVDDYYVHSSDFIFE